MKYAIILLFMIFFHIVDDYYLQGILASMKQKSWWTNNPDYEYKYRNDYLVALFMHSFSWTFMVMLPVVVYLSVFGTITWTFFYLFVINLFCHAYTDNEKANKKTINLVQDQSIHIFQIVMTFVILILIGV